MSEWPLNYHPKYNVPFVRGPPEVLKGTGNPGEAISYFDKTPV